MHASAASDEASAPAARHVRAASAARGTAKGGYIVDGTSDEGSDDDEAKASAAMRTYVASAASEDDEAVSTAERRACAAMAARHADGGRLRQRRPSRRKATASAARRTRTTKAAQRMGVNEAASDAKGDDVAGGRQGGLPHPLLQRRGQRSALLGRQEGLPHPLLRRRGQRDHIFIAHYDVDKNTSKNVLLFSKRGERCKINKKRRSSPHVEIDSTCSDDRQFYE